MMDRVAEKRSTLESIASLPLSSRKRLIRKLSNRQADRLLTAWKYRARPDQLEPPGDWRIWLFVGGRGAGKTRAGAEWVAEQIRAGCVKRVALIAATDAD